MKTRFKALAFLAIMAVFIPMSLSAQKSDGFFRSGNNDYQNREEFVINGNSEGGLSNYGIGETVPVGSGLLIMLTAGAGYAVLRRKKAVRKGVTLLLALTMVLSFTQCKKKLDTINPTDQQMVNITLDVSGGSRVVVNPYWTENPTYATVDYETGDKVYVGYDGLYVGYLTYNAETNKFSGSISATPIANSDKPLHFYFLGGQGFEDYFEDYIDYYDNKSSYVKISDQTERYPVISYAHSRQIYTGSGEYTAKLQNKCSIVKFIVDKTGSSESSTVTIGGVTNFVAIDFTDPSDDNNNGFSFFKGADGGYITMSHRSTHTAEPNAYWAIMLPDDEVEEGVLGSVFTSDNYIGIRPEIPEIGVNQYLPDGINITINQECPQNAFSVSRSKKVIFSSGNLQYQPSTSTWRFAENEWDYIGAATNPTGISYKGDTGGNVDGSDNVAVNDPSSYSGWFDLFGWGTGDKPLCISRDNDEYNWVKDWGNNDIYDGGSLTQYTWFTMTEKEWEGLLGKDGNNIRKNKYAAAIVMGYPGLVILPDLFVLPAGCSFEPGMIHDDDDFEHWDTWMVHDEDIYDATEWAAMSAAGAVFLPAGGVRNLHNNGGSYMAYCHNIGLNGHYWTCTANLDYPPTASEMHFCDQIDDYGDDNIDVTGCDLFFGHSVRLVRDITPSDK